METLAKLALGPLLLLQGRYVRRTAAVLPEPVGLREGVTGIGPALGLLILGDSSAAGVGTVHQRQALCGRLVAQLASSHTVHWRLLAQSGLNADEVLQLLLAHDAEAYDVAVLCCGVNEVTGGFTVQESVRRIGLIVATLRERHQVRRVLLSPVPPMHRFPALPQPLRWFLGLRARKLDAALRAAICDWDGAELVDHAIPLTPQTIAADGFHPGTAGYAAWAAALAANIMGQ